MKNFYCDAFMKNSIPQYSRRQIA